MKKERSHQTHERSSIEAFSLVEVTIALGIAAFAVLSIIALLPTGLNVLRSSMDTTLQVQIFSLLSAEIEQVPFERLPTYASSGPYGFDSDGQRTTTTNETFYSAEIKLITPDFPGSSQDIGNSLINVQIRVTGLRNQAPIIQNLYVSRADTVYVEN